jgi:hypothetical protein
MIRSAFVSSRNASILALAGLVAASVSGYVVLSRANLFPSPTAEFACPDVGTVFTTAMPLALSESAGKPYHFRMLERDRFACRYDVDNRQPHWIYAGLTDNPSLEWRAAAEELWPLKVGNATHARFKRG